MCLRMRACAQWASPVVEAFQIYQTTKIVQIKDHRLGWLYYGLTLLIVLFVVGYEILYCNDHFDKRDVTGTPQTSIQQPTVGMCNPNKPDCDSDFTPLSDLPYCRTYTGNSTVVKPKNRQQCIYADKHTLVPTVSNGGSIFVPTRLDNFLEDFPSDMQELGNVFAAKFARFQEVRSCRPSRLNGYTCRNEYQKQSSTGKQLVADIERFTLLIAHSYQRDTISGNNNPIEGSYLECNRRASKSAFDWATRVFFGAKECPGGYTRKYIPCIVGSCGAHPEPEESSVLQTGPGAVGGTGHKTRRKGSGRFQAAGLQPEAASTEESPGQPQVYAIPDGDVFTIGKLLELAGVNLDGTVNLDGDPLRAEGSVMEIQVHYNNLHPFRSTFGNTEVEYWYNVAMRPMHQVKDEMVLWQNEDSSRRVIQNRHGIAITVTVMGTFGFFSLMNLLLMLTTAAALLTVSTVLTDKIALYFMEKRDIYSQRKYENVNVEQFEA